MKKFLVLIIFLELRGIVYAGPLQGQARNGEVAVSSLTAASATALSKADVALARSFVVRNTFKGCFGESIAEKSFIDTHLTNRGDWQSITPRSGPQGLDHLFIKTKNGVITDVMIGESKFNTSRLITTIDGNVQMSEGWIGVRLRRLGWRYTWVSELKEVNWGKPPLNPARKLCVVLKSGKKVYFWSDGTKWSFTGSREDLAEAQLRARQYGSYFDKASSGMVKYRSRVFNILPKGNDVEIAIYDAKTILNGNLHSTKPQAVLRLKNALISNDAISETELASQIQRKLGLGEEDSIQYARKVLKEYNAKSLMGEFSLAKHVLINSAKASAAGVVLDVAVQLIENREVDPALLAFNAGGVFLGATVGQVTHVLLTSPKAYNVIQNISGPLRCSTPMATSLLSSMTAGVSTSAILSYGAYFLGYSDLKTANRQMAIGTASTGAGVALTYGAMWVATTYGTAGTGVAISSLSGAAATNAALAWLGGGTVASGGGGMTAGTLVIGGGMVAAAVAVGAIGYYGFKMYDQHEDTVRICDELEYYQRNDFINLVAALKNDYRYAAFHPAR